ncbi:hypothetical protein [Bradyrhizobium sp. AUGA SZCCT0431]|uniref:hypothetical protein n=1 Tax=Bradyrhizobium sp. AUGA SZCCT0431 TaxID=2807674 RepID=UPI001BABA3E3|nr:hypothetical protein [Bradyrhizobium sp. AUGA SZCCT0431]MBR1143361.1 hypothetical protein [Bradyrhizobium sp. AUGA SZCCT0431]
MLELIGTTVLTAVIALSLNAAITMMPLSPLQKLTTVTIVGLWTGLAIALGTTGIYASTATPVPVVGVMLALPLVAIGAAALLSARLRETLLALPMRLLLGLNALRILPGAFILLLASQGKLSGPFPQSAGWGDIIVGVTAIPLMLVAARNFAGSRHALLAWNVLGTLDLVEAVALGVLSAPGSPQQIFGGAVGSTAMWSLPWSTIPTLLVPFYFITHGIVFAQLLQGKRQTDAFAASQARL